MDFFEHQERARRNTSRLVFFYGLAVALIVCAVYCALAFTLNLAQPESAGAATAGWLRVLWNPGLFALASAGTLAVVLGGSAYKVMGLARGGRAVATLLGGRPIPRNTADLNERRTLNVVEEMAIAAGIPVPPVYLLENEPGINAFAAGFNPADAVIGITRGAVRQLSRDELQGVVAHEFSHIFNGDMRLNIRLMGVLHGILLIGLIGYWLLRSSMYSGRYRSSRKGKGNSGAQLALLGLALSAIGFIGVFFAKLIKSAVSRQREFLADAAAVQFTRNPDGIAGALKKIGGLYDGSRIREIHAEEASHFFFANGLSSAWFSLMATHPPLAERIRRIDPSFNGVFPALPAEPQPAEPAAAATRTTGLPVSAMAAGAAGRKVRINPRTAVTSVGAPGEAHLRYSQGILASLPPKLETAVRDTTGAQAVVFNLLLSSATATRARQQQILRQTAGTAVEQAAGALADPVRELPLELRLPLADMAIATLKELPAGQFVGFRAGVEQMIAADERVDLFEYALYRMLLRHLIPYFEQPRPTPVRYYSLKPLIPACIDLLSCLAYRGDSGGAAVQRHFEAGWARLPVSPGADAPDMRPRPDCGVSALDAALEKLAESEPALKKQIMDACVACVAADGTINAAEAQVLRAVGDALNCPVPPLMAGAEAA